MASGRLLGFFDLVRLDVDQLVSINGDAVLTSSDKDGVVPPARDMSLGVPTFDGGGRDIAELRGHRPDAVEFLKDALQETTLRSDHDVRLAHRNRTGDVRQSHSR